MKGDYSRITFNPSNQYSGVRFQQGRVQTDADFNEQYDIVLNRLETGFRDYIGQSGVPEGDSGFLLTGKSNTIQIGKGRCYVDGKLLANPEDILLTAQPDLPGVELPTEDGLYLAYLDVWQRHITALEAPNIQDAALGNQDTSTRIKNVWQVKMVRFGEKDVEPTAAQLAALEPGAGWTPAKQTQKGDDLPCSTGKLKARVSGDGSHLGNQLYQVAIHTPGKAETATYKWSRDNASNGARVLAINDKKITIRFIGRGTEDGYKAGDLLEITNDLLELNGKPGVLAKVKDVNDAVLTMEVEEKDKD